MTVTDPMALVYERCREHGLEPEGLDHEMPGMVHSLCAIEPAHGRKLLVVWSNDHAVFNTGCGCRPDLEVEALGLKPLDLVERELEPEPEPEPARRRDEARLRSASKIAMRNVEWLWEERAPLGKLAVLAGLAGQGKSLLTCWIAARASRGELPGRLFGTPVSVLIASAEDDPEDTIVPRLMLAGADLDRVLVLDMRLPGGVSRSIQLPGDGPAITGALELTGARLVILDPISALLDSQHDAYRNQDVRRALAPLKQAMEEAHACGLMVSHVVPKSQGTDALQRLADSHAFSGLPRSVLMFGPELEDVAGDRGRTKVLTVAKSNLASPGEHGLRFSISTQRMVTHGNLNGHGPLVLALATRVDLLGETSTSTADLLSPATERSALHEAMDFLREQLKDGPMRSAALNAEAEAAGISERTLKRARAKVCGRAYRDGDGPWMVALARAHAHGEAGPLDPLGPLSEGTGLAKSAKEVKGAKDSRTRAREGRVIQFKLGDDPEAPNDPPAPDSDA